MERRIQDFRNLNLDSSDDEIYNKKNKKSSILEQEFIIEIPVSTKPQSKAQNKAQSKTQNKMQSKTQNNIKNETISKNKSTKKISNNTKASAKNNKNINSKTMSKKPNSKFSNDTSQFENLEIYDDATKKKNKTPLIVSFFLLILVLIGVCAGVLTTDTFNVTIIEAQDGTNITSAEIQRYFDDVKNKNTFLINTGEIEKELKKHPYIYKINISRSLPNKLVVKYEERVPYAIIKYLETYVLLDRYGSILELMQENKYENLPIIYGIETEELSAGQELEGISKLKYENIVFLLRTAEHINFEYTIAELNYSDTDELTFLVNELEVEIIYGTIDKEIISDKLAYLNEILKELVDKKGTLDISSENYSEKVIFSNNQIGGVSYEQ